MKKSPKPAHPHRKLIVQREVVAQLKPTDLTHVVGADGRGIFTQSSPFCPQN